MTCILGLLKIRKVNPFAYIRVQNSKRVRVKKEESINKRSPDNNVYGLNQVWGDVWFLSLLVGKGKNCFWLYCQSSHLSLLRLIKGLGQGLDLGYWAKTLSKWLYKNQQSLSRWQSDQHWVDSADLRGFWDHKTLSGPHLTFVIDWWLTFGPVGNLESYPICI